MVIGNRVGDIVLAFIVIRDIKKGVKLNVDSRRISLVNKGRKGLLVGLSLIVKIYYCALMIVSGLNPSFTFV